MILKALWVWAKDILFKYCLLFSSPDYTPDPHLRGRLRHRLRIWTTMWAARSPLLQAGMVSFTDSRNWHMQTPTQKDMSKKKQKEKWWPRCSVTCSDCQMTIDPKHSGGPGSIKPYFLVSDSQGPVAGWRLWQHADWPRGKPLEGHGLMRFGGQTHRADLSLPYS